MKQRDYYFDNAKFILIFFVVFGHLLRSFIEHNEIVFALYKVIYTFHMPAFILVSGFFARGFNKSGYIWNVAKKLLLPYLIFQLIYSVFYYFLYEKPQLGFDPFNPHWSLWFLISLFFWNLMLIPFSKFPALVGLTTSLLLGIGVGYIDWISNYLSLSRTFVFFPMFLLGYHMTKEHIQMLTRPAFRLFAVLSFIVALGFYSLYPEINYQWLLGSKPYSAMTTTFEVALLTRSAFYLLSAIMVFSFLSFVPSRQYFFTDLGKNTLYVYLLHGFFVRVFRESSVTKYFQEPENYLLLAAISLILTFFLSGNFTTAIAQPFIELKLSRFLKEKQRAKTLVKQYTKRILSN